MDPPGGDITKPLPDQWALRYVDVVWLQPIMEAFDEDGSGLITISELNRFRPAELNWRHAAYNIGLPIGQLVGA